MKKEYLKDTDAWSTVLFADPLAIPMMKLLALLRIHPNVVTLSTLVPFFFSCFFFFKGDHKSLILGAIFWQLSWILDCADGKLAKYTGKVTEFGAKLDSRLDALRKFVALLFLFYGVFLKRNRVVLGLFLFLYHYGVHILFHRIFKINIYRRKEYVTPMEKRAIKRVGEYYTSYDEQFLMLFIGPLLNRVELLWAVATTLYLLKGLTVFLRWRKK